MPLLKDQTMEHLTSSFSSPSFDSFLEESKCQPQRWAGRKRLGKTDIHRLTDGSRTEDHDDDEIGEEAERAGQVSLENSKSLMGWSKNIEPDHSLVPRDRPKRQWAKVKYRKFQLNVRKRVFLLFKHWSSLPETVMESPSLEIFKSKQHTSMGSVL